LTVDYKVVGIEHYLSNRLTAPATTGDATLVPDNERHPPLKGTNNIENCKYFKLAR